MLHRALLILFLEYEVLAATDSPNIVIIVADDMGWNDVGFNGGDVNTPNLDALAAQGVIISRHYAMPCCTPSRTALMTGRYAIRSGMQSKPLGAGVPISLPLSEKIFPEYFHDLGYKTHLIGKWHLGYHTPAHLPTRRGFDSFYGYLNGFVSYYDGTHTQSGISGRDMMRNEEGVALEVYGKYLTKVLSQEAVSVIKEHPGRGGMLMFLMNPAPHTGNLGFPREAPPGLAPNATHRQILRETVRHLDKSVGDVVTALNNKGVLNNTIIVFFSDNGAPTVDELYHYDNYGSNWPLRGEKMSNRDGGVRTPSFIWSPLFREKPSVSQQLFHISDWLPTLYSAAGGNLSDVSDSVTLDGVDQWESFTSSATPPRTELLVDINDIYNSESYIINNWKLVKDPNPYEITSFAGKYYGDSGSDFTYDEDEVTLSPVGRILPKPMVDYNDVRKMSALKTRCNNTVEVLKEDCHSKYCLYDLIEDPSECTDVASRYPDIVRQLKERLDDYRKVMVPTTISSYDPRSNPKNWDDYWSPWMEDPTSGASATRPNYFLSKFIILVFTLNVLLHLLS